MKVTITPVLQFKLMKISPNIVADLIVDKYDIKSSVFIDSETLGTKDFLE